MKTSLFINIAIALFITQLSLHASSINYSRVWIDQYSGITGPGAGDYGKSVITDSSGNIYITGYTEGGLDGNTNNGYSDFFLSKYNDSGTRLWTKQFGTSQGDIGRSITIDNNDNIYIMGSTGGDLDGNTNNGGNNIFLTKFNSDGSKIWTRQYGGDGGYNIGESVTTDSNGNIYITGVTDGDLDGNTNINNGYWDIFLTKYSSDGIRIWTKQYGSIYGDAAYSVTSDGSDNIYITGYTTHAFDGNTNSGGNDIFLTKFTSDGTRHWTKQYGSVNNDHGWSVTTDSSGNIYITGRTYGPLDGNTYSGGMDIFLTKYSSAGSKLWTRQYGSRYDDWARSVTTDSIGNIYITGHTLGDLDGNIGSPGRELFLTKYSSDGTRHWTDQYGNNKYVWPESITTDSSDNIYITGTTYGAYRDIFLTKYSRNQTDFTTNGHNDLLWHEESTGAIKIMQMNGMTPEESIDVVDSSNINLLPRGIGDFTGDGKPDILFHNQNSGNLRIWEMNGTVKGENIQILGSSNTNLKIAGVGDFDGDGDNDIATFNTNSGALRIWVMEGTERVDNILVLTGANTYLVPRGAGDMDGDGIPDIVLRNNNSGAVRIWTMNSNFTRKGNEYIRSSSNTNLEIRGVVDINGDGNNDILNYNTSTGMLRAWLMDGNLSITENAEIVQEEDLDWSVRN